MSERTIDAKRLIERLGAALTWRGSWVIYLRVWQMGK